MFTFFDYYLGPIGDINNILEFPMTNLRELDITLPHYYRGFSLRFADFCPNLKKLRVASLSKLEYDDQGGQAIYESMSSVPLQELEINHNGSQVSVDFFTDPLEFNELKKLSITRSTLKECKIYNVMAPKIENLTIISPVLNSIERGQFQAIEIVKMFPQIKHLTINDRYVLLLDDHLRLFAYHLKKLETLTIYKNRNSHFSQFCIEFLAENARNLREFTLYNSDYPTGYRKILINMFKNRFGNDFRVKIL